MAERSERPHIPEEVREHFYTQEERHSLEALEGEGRVYETKMHLFLEHLTERLESAEIDPEKQERIEGLVRDIQTKSFNYIDSRIAFARAAEALRYSGTSAQSVVMEADQRRRAAHNALLDSIQIATRNVISMSRDEGPLPPEFHELVDKAEGGYREKVANAAIDYVWQQLDREEWEERTKGLKKF